MTFQIWKKQCLLKYLSEYIFKFEPATIVENLKYVFQEIIKPNAIKVS